jgi:hypothetical protein
MRRANLDGRCTRFCFSVALKIAAGRAITKCGVAEFRFRRQDVFEIGD